nr:AbrB/MazE/SpoVT family DNA-binding domain-containing protein [Polymorphobacter sp.]
MNTVSISPKFQVVIPRQIREDMKLRPGQKLQALNVGGVIQLVPIMSIEDAYGFLGPCDEPFVREKQDRKF